MKNRAEQPWLSLPKGDLESVLKRTLVAWERFRGARIFVTGGTGFFGKWLLESFDYANAELELRAELVCLTRDVGRTWREMPHLVRSTSIRFVQGDVRSFPFPAGVFSHIIHAATEASAALDRDAPRLMFDVIVQGTRRVLEFSERCGAQHVLFVSSGAIYGRQPQGVTHVREEFTGGLDPTSPFSAYREGKRFAELLCAELQDRRGVSFAMARCFAFVGPYLPLDRHFAIGNFLKDALARQAIKVNSAGRDYRSYMYAGEVCVWLWTMLARAEGCRAYNVGSDHAVSILQAAQMVASVAKTTVEVKGGESAAEVEPAYYVPCIERARSELGQTVEIDLRAAIERTLEWYRAMPRPTGNFGRELACA